MFRSSAVAALPVKSPTKPPVAVIIPVVSIFASDAIPATCQVGACPGPLEVKTKLEIPVVKNPVIPGAV